MIKSEYFKKHIEPNRPSIKVEWLEEATYRARHQQPDPWGCVEVAISVDSERQLIVVFRPDRQTVHTAYFTNRKKAGAKNIQVYYDDEFDSLFISLNDRQAVFSVKAAENVIIDYDADNCAVSIDIRFASDFIRK